MTREELFAADERLDIQVCGRSLAAAGPTRFAADGAHDPTPTPYFVLDELLGGLSLGRGDHLLDVGCGRGRVLAYAARRFPAARVTGVELDPALAEYASSWSEGIPGVSVRRGSALGLSLAPYTHFYLFNPFDTPCWSDSCSVWSGRSAPRWTSSTCPITARPMPTWSVPDGGW